MCLRFSTYFTVSVLFWYTGLIPDLATLRDRATYEQPREYPAGVDWVLVNGVVTIDHGRHTGAKAGKVLYGPGRDQSVRGARQTSCAK